MHELTMLRGRNSLRPEWYGAQQVPFSTGGLQECDCRQFARNLHSGWVACGAPRPMETERCTRILPARRREPDRRSPHSRKWRCGAWLWVGTGRLVLDWPCAPCASGSRFGNGWRSEEHTSELQSLMRISYAVFCLQKKK